MPQNTWGQIVGIMRGSFLTCFGKATLPVLLLSWLIWGLHVVALLVAQVTS